MLEPWALTSSVTWSLILVHRSFLMLGLLQLEEGYPFNTENVLFLKAYFCCTEASTKMSVRSCGMMISHIKSCLKFYRSLWLTNTAYNSRGVGAEGQASPFLGKPSASPLMCGTAQVSQWHTHRASADWNQLQQKRKQFHQIGESLLSEDFQHCAHQKAQI